MLLDFVDPTVLGGSILQGIIAAGVLDSGIDPALSAAWKALEALHVPQGKRHDWNKAAELLLREVGRCQTAVMLKRGMWAKIEEWLQAAEYVLAGGNSNVMLCERGIRTFEIPDIHKLDPTALGIILRSL